jgi:hypothetical protein
MSDPLTRLRRATTAVWVTGLLCAGVAMVWAARPPRIEGVEIPAIREPTCEVDPTDVRFDAAAFDVTLWPRPAQTEAQAAPEVAEPDPTPTPPPVSAAPLTLELLAIVLRDGVPVEAVLFDQAEHSVVRCAPGQAAGEFTVTSIEHHHATLTHGSRTVRLSLDTSPADRSGRERGGGGR